MSIEMYKENILDHFTNPRNYGSLKDCEIHHEEKNPLCGDEIEIFIKLDNQKKVKDIKFKGNGCAISISSISMLTDHLKGKSLDQIKKMGQEDVLDLLKIPIGPIRMKCALLSLRTIQRGIIKNEQARNKKS